MDEREIRLGGRVFNVPRLPLGVSMLVYPVCQRLTNGGLAERLLRRDTALEITDAEAADLIDVAFQLAHAVDDGLDPKAFLAMTVTPPELFDAFFVARTQCGGWRAQAVGAGDGDAPGERLGADMPPPSTSTASSPSSSAISTNPSTTG